MHVYVGCIQLCETFIRFNPSEGTTQTVNVCHFVNEPVNPNPSHPLLVHFNPQSLCSRVRCSHELDPGGGATGGDSGDQVVDEGGLRTGTGLNDNITELVLVDGDTLGDGVVLPVAVVDLVGVHALAVERQVLEHVGVAPAWDVLAGVELADSDGLEIGQPGEKQGWRWKYEVSVYLKTRMSGIPLLIMVRYPPPVMKEPLKAMSSAWCALIASMILQSFSVKSTSSCICMCSQAQ